LEESTTLNAWPSCHELLWTVFSCFKFLPEIAASFHYFLKFSNYGCTAGILRHKTITRLKMSDESNASSSLFFTIDLKIACCFRYKNARVSFSVC